MKQKIISLLLVFGLLFSATSFAQQTKPNKKANKEKKKVAAKSLPRLSMEYFLSQSIQNNPEIARIRKESASQRYSARRTRALRDFILTAGASYSAANKYLNNGIPMGEDFKVYNFYASVAKKFPSLLGMTAKLDLKYNGMTGTVYGSGALQEYTPSIGISITLPILANGLGKIDRNSLKSMKLSIRALEKTEKESFEAYLLELYKAYLDWALLVEKTRLYRGFMGRAAGLLGQTVRKRNVGMADWSDVHLANQNYLRYRSLYLATDMQAKQSYLSVLSYMKGKPLQTKLISTTVDVKWAPTIAFEYKDVVLGKVVASENIRLVQLARLQLEMAKLEYHSAASAAKPELNAIINGSKGSGGSSLSSSFDSFDRDQIYMGLEFKMPLQNSDKKNERKAKRAAFEKSKKEYKSTVTKITYSLKNLRFSIATLRKVMDVNAKMVTASQYLVGSLYRKYIQGRVALKQVADARDSYANARISYLDQVVTLKKLAVDYQSLTDRLFERYKKYFKKQK